MRLLCSMVVSSYEAISHVQVLSTTAIPTLKLGAWLNFACSYLTMLSLGESRASCSQAALKLAQQHTL